ncbi:MAG: transketolase [Proteobacteria bacterium]|nr:transketolase [Pseudomonadota bacterium]NOG60460.1 transketolase [Pseudomonadota bacterium]
MLTRHELANAIRALSMDAVQQANSGHPGAPMGMADIAEVLWNDFLKHNPANPNWDNRDRFVMSNGHGSMLVYSLLHLSGYDLPIEELKSFRQLHSKTPGHPEYGYAPGVETTTGPLGQGLANAVGMALAESILAAKFNKDSLDIVNHHTYVSVGDGCLMEGISHEACSFAGTMGLGKLVAIYDDNKISIDGDVSGWFTEDIPKRFESYGWHVIPDVDGHDPDAIKKALTEAKANEKQPTIICCKTIIGWGSPNKEGKESCHGAPLGDDEIKLTREKLGWTHDAFVIPDEHYAAWDAKEKGKELETVWNEKFSAYESAHPELAAEYKRRMAGKLPDNWDSIAKDYIDACNNKGDTIASRKASQNAIEAFASQLPEMLGGSADLTGSNLTNWSGSVVINSINKNGNYISYGVREFAMSAIDNGVALHGGFIPYSGTFLMFSEYARNALRMAALMKVQNIFVYTHDSIGLGEDGPTHQGVEQAATLRLMPNMSLWRPCDAVESAVAWQAAIERRDGPTSLLFSRQNLAHIDRDDTQLKNIQRGGYSLLHGSEQPDAVIIATGSEVEIAMNVAKQLNSEGKNIRVVSMPSTDVFDQQDDDYKETVLPDACRKRIAIEAGVTDYWRKYIGLDGKALGVDTFGESAPAKTLFEHFGLTETNLKQTVNDLLT